MNIVILDGYATNPGDLSWDKLKELGNVTIYDRTPSNLAYERAKDADVIITNKTVINKELVDKLNNLKYVGVLATGYNVVDLEACNKKNIVVTNVPAYSTASVVQLIFAYILELFNFVSVHDESVKKGEWVNSQDFSYIKAPISEMEGKTIGIIGYGNIGAKIAKVAEGFDMNVLVYSRTKKESPENVKWVSLEELIKESDIITVNCPLTEATKGLVNKEFLSKMKKSAILINTSRGPVVVEEDLKDALNNDVIRAAAVDVLYTEPPMKENPLLHAKNILITPHIAWATFEARTRLVKVATNNVKAFIEGNPTNKVN